MVKFGVIFELKILPRNFTRDVTLITVFVATYTVVWLPVHIILKSMIAKLIPPSIQSFSQGLVAGIMGLAMIIPGFTTPLLMPWIHFWAFALIVIVAGNIVFFVVRRGSLTNIKVVSLDN